MAQTTMYPITTAGLQTVLTQALSTNDTQLYVHDITVFDNAANLVTIKTNSTTWEVCKYTGKTAVSGNEGYLTIVRSGTEHLSSDAGNAAVSFNAGAKAFRGLTNYDYAALRENIMGIDMRVVQTNLIINGGFTINQRVYVTNTAKAAGVYCHDRWKAGESGVTYSFTQLESPTQITISAGSLIQVVENCNVQGGTYVLSWSGTSLARVAKNGGALSGAFASSPIVVTGQNAGQAMSVEFNTGTLGTVKLESGVTATGFVHCGSHYELERCMRYYQICAIKYGEGTLATIKRMTYGLPVAMRTVPTITPTLQCYISSWVPISSLEVASDGKMLMVNAYHSQAFYYVGHDTSQTAIPESGKVVLSAEL